MTDSETPSFTNRDHVTNACTEESGFGADAAVRTDPTDQSNRPPAKRRPAVREDEMEVGDEKVTCALPRVRIVAGRRNTHM